MEVFIEQMVRKCRSKSDILVVLGLSLGSTIIGFLLFSLMMSTMGRHFSSILFLAIAAVFYFAYNLATARNIEYEYSMVNHEIDIDKIANQKRRKRLTTVNVKNLEEFGRKCKNPRCEQLMSDVSVKKIYACEDKNAEDTFYAVYFEDGVRKMILFTPKTEIVDLIVKFNPREQYII